MNQTIQLLLIWIWDCRRIKGYKQTRKAEGALLPEMLAFFQQRHYEEKHYEGSYLNSPNRGEGEGPRTYKIPNPTPIYQTLNLRLVPTLRDRALTFCSSEAVFCLSQMVSALSMPGTNGVILCHRIAGGNIKYYCGKNMVILKNK